MLLFGKTKKWCSGKDSSLCMYRTLDVTGAAMYLYDHIINSLLDFWL